MRAGQRPTIQPTARPLARRSNMEIKDINVEVERLEEVRGGVSNIGLQFANMGGDDNLVSSVHNFGLGDVGVAQSVVRPQTIGQNLHQSGSESTTTAIGISESMVGVFPFLGGYLK